MRIFRRLASMSSATMMLSMPISPHMRLMLRRHRSVTIAQS